MNVVEEAFVKTFIDKGLRDRWLTRLKLERTRGTLLRKLAHSLLPDLDPRFVYEEDNLPLDIEKEVRRVSGEWRKKNPEGLCHIIACSERDGQTISIETLDEDYLLTFGAIIIVIPEKLAYYRTERSNLSRQPFYVLFRP